MKVEFEPEGNSTFVFPFDEVDVAEAFLAEAIRFFAAEGQEISPQVYEVLRAMRAFRLKHLQ